MAESVLPFLNTKTPPPSWERVPPKPASVRVALDPQVEPWVSSDISSTVAAALAALLFRYALQPNVVIGAWMPQDPSRPGAHALPAPDVILLNIPVDAHDTFADLLVRTTPAYRGTASQGGFPHGGVAPIGHDAALELMLCVDHAPAADRLSLLVRAPLVVHVVAGPQASTIDLIYDRAIIAEDAISRFAAQLAQTLRSGAANPRQAIKDIDILPPAERHRLLLEWSGDTAPRPNKTVIDLLEEQCTASPSRIAYICDDEVLTYEEVNGKANSLARELHELGVQKGDVIPLLLDQSLDLIFSALALMKLGAVFVPLDVQWPHSRIERMLKDLAPRAVLTNPNCQPSVAGSYLVKRVDSSTLSSSRMGPRNPVSPDEALYGYYTSGSTGVPKCAINIHRGIVNRFLYMTKRYRADGSEVILQNSKHVFDAWIWQVFWPLTNGAKVVLPRSTRVFDLLGTIELISKHRVTMTDFVPSVFNVLVDYVTKTNPSARHKVETLRHILIGGEELHPEASHTFKSLLPQVGLTNTYGPTETSIGTIFFELGSQRYRSVPIGRPIDNVKAVLLDEHRNLVPLGAVGEIYLGGLCVGRGYLNDPERTRAVFIENPFPELGCPTLYRTGDLAYYLPDGNIQFVGRRDQQVKVRGVRIELGEIESVLLLHPEVGQAKVVLDKRVSGREELIAYIVGTRALVDLRAIKEHVRREIPEYMVPAHFVLLDAMPLDHNGKVDRKRLLENFAPETAPAPVEEPFEPQSTDDTALTEAWREIFKVKRIGRSDDFFDLGGNSLHGVRLLCAIQERLGIVITIHDLYENRTIGKLASLIKAVREGAGKATRTPSRLAEIDNDVRTTAVIGDGTDLGRPDTELKHVLLTGATGFVGAHLLNELLTRTDASVYCLVRAHGEVGALLRLRENVTHYGFKADAYLSRIHPVPGDLGRAHFGLGEEQYREFARRIDTVVHSGALVDYLRDYTGHRSANVLGTAEVLRFASTGRAKCVHHVSTLGVLPLSQPAVTGHRFLEDELPDEKQLPRDGYSQSKWVAERLVMAARERGVPANIYRLGEVMPATAVGVPNPKAFLHLVIKTFLTLAIAPRTDAVIDYVPADHVARTLLHIATGPESRSTTFNVRHPTGVRLSSMLDVFRSVGVHLEDVTYDRFLERLDGASRVAGPESELTLVRSLLEAGSREGAAGSDPLRQLFDTDCARIDNRNAERALKRSGILLPADERDLVRSYAVYCKRSLR